MIHSIRARLAVVSAVVVLVAGGAIGVASYLRLRAKLDEADLEYARHEALEVAAAVAGLDSASGIRHRIEEAGLFPEAGVDSLAVLELDGRPLVWFPRDAAPPALDWPAGLVAALEGESPAEQLADKARGHPAIQALHLADAHRPRWIALAQVSRERSEATLADFRLRLVLGVPLLAVLVLAGSFGLVTQALRPLQAVVADARALAGEGPEGGGIRRLAAPPAGSELAELVGLLNVMLGRTEETLSQLRRFAANASHELRTPLMRMRGEAELALRAGTPPEEACAALASVIEEVDALVRLVEGLIELSRGEAGGLPGEQLDLADLATSLAAEAALLGQERELRVEVAREGSGEAIVRGSRDLLGRALWNVLDNALKYVPRGERVDVRIAVTETQVQVTIEDSGPGVGADAQHRLFEAFYRGDAARIQGAPGTGLGLALARTIVRRHGGDLVLAPFTGRGARFVLTVPRRGAGSRGAARPAVTAG